jgi:hypothetical protein
VCTILHSGRILDIWTYFGSLDGNTFLSPPPSHKIQINVLGLHTTNSSTNRGTNMLLKKRLRQHCTPLKSWLHPKAPRPDKWVLPTPASLGPVGVMVILRCRIRFITYFIMEACFHQRVGPLDGLGSPASARPSRRIIQGRDIDVKQALASPAYPGWDNIAHN